MDGRSGVVDENAEIMDPSKIMGGIYIKEEIIIPDDPPEEGFEVEEGGEEEEDEEEYQPADENYPNYQNYQNYQITAEDGSVLNGEPTEMAIQEPGPEAEQEVMFDHFEAWRKWKKLKRKLPKKSNIQVYEVYRNENYFVTHRYAGEEEFACNE